MAAEKKPIDREGAEIDLLRLERIAFSLERRIDALRDRNGQFPSTFTEQQLNKLVAEHESVSALIGELRIVAGVVRTS
jgi:hypothetical protein